MEGLNSTQTNSNSVTYNLNIGECEISITLPSRLVYNKVYVDDLLTMELFSGTQKNVQSKSYICDYGQTA